MFLFGVCFCACIAGAICGIGGGVIIKPVLDAAGTMDLASINFLSGCTVLSMTAYSVGRSKLTGSSRLDLRISVPLAVGAAVGGVLGKLLFQVLRARSANPDRVGAVQAGCLLFLTVATLLYTLKKSKIHTYRMEKQGVCLLIGFLLGMLSSFLGIGGGPVNLVVLFYFFSMDTKTAAENSLYIILFSQIASLLYSFAAKNVPPISAPALTLMAAGGICGGICGRGINKRMSERAVDRLFIVLMVVMIALNTRNLLTFMQ